MSQSGVTILSFQMCPKGMRDVITAEKTIDGVLYCCIQGLVWCAWRHRVNSTASETLMNRSQLANSLTIPVCMYVCLYKLLIFQWPTGSVHLLQAGLFYQTTDLFRLLHYDIQSRPSSSLMLRWSCQLMGFCTYSTMPAASIWYEPCVFTIIHLFDHHAVKC